MCVMPQFSRLTPHLINATRVHHQFVLTDCSRSCVATRLIKFKTASKLILNAPGLRNTAFNRSFQWSKCWSHTDGIKKEMYWSDVLWNTAYCTHYNKSWNNLDFTTKDNAFRRREKKPKSNEWFKRFVRTQGLTKDYLVQRCKSVVIKRA